MLTGPPSKDDLRNTFEAVLAGIEDGSLPAAPDGNGLPMAVNQALNAIVGETSRRATRIIESRDAFNGWLALLGTDARNDQFISELFGTN
jgi:hypothetical protein